jgi:hypothetical protein
MYAHNFDVLISNAGVDGRGPDVIDIVHGLEQQFKQQFEQRAGPYIYEPSAGRAPDARPNFADGHHRDGRADGELEPVGRTHEHSEYSAELFGVEFNCNHVAHQ